jgi:UDP-N-acetylmuramoyl-L-alanyl-D-glutamate--2,6-diaminopimelate ligase
LEHSPKRPRIIVANTDDAYGEKFLDAKVEVRAPFYLSQSAPYTADDRSVRFVYQGELFTVPLPGLFNLKNVLAALAFGSAMQIPLPTMQHALAHVAPVAGRAERIERGQNFAVIVDYAHTPDSLKALFEAFAGRRLICVIGSTGGGRDQWKRPQMGAIADELCEIAFIANEDPYDEDPQHIVETIAQGFKKHQPRIVLNRRGAIAAALREAREGDAVLLTGKGTDPFIMGPHGSKESWSDRKVAEEELDKLLAHPDKAR